MTSSCNTPSKLIQWRGQARAVAKAHSGNQVDHPEPHDLLLCSDLLPETYTDMLITTECGPWSRASGPVPPRGFNDPRAKLFVKSCAIIQDQLSRNPLLNYVFENVDIHPALAATDGPEQERLLGSAFHVINAKELGNMSSRPRRIASNMADPTKLVFREPPQPSFAIGTHSPCIHPMHCLVSKKDTWNRQQCFDSVTQELRDLTGDERDVYMGHVSGSTRYALHDDGSRTNVSENYRRELLGKGICEAHVGAYFYHRKNDSDQSMPRTMMAKIEEASPEQAELFLVAMDRPTRVEWFKTHSLSDYKPLELRLKMDLSNGIPQNRTNYGQGGKLDASMQHALDGMVIQRILAEVKPAKDQMVSPCFPKLKPGRTFPDNDLPLVRPLADLRGPNLKILLDNPNEWMEINPTRSVLTCTIPHGTKFFGNCDIHDAFHHAPVHKDSQKYLVIHWKGRYYMYLFCPQGLKVGSGFFMAFMMHIFNSALGSAWSSVTPPLPSPATSTTVDTPGTEPSNSSVLPYSQPWWVGYADDWMPIGDTRSRAQGRQDILQDILDVVNVPISPKCDNSVKEYGTLIGLHWTEHGHCLSNDAVDSLVTALLLVPKTTTDARAVIGLINYSETAFTYSPHEQARHGTLMTILSEAVTLGPRLSWGDDAKRAVNELSLRMQNLPRAYYDPIQLFASGEFILIILGDASKTGAGSSIYLVRKVRAEDFNKSDLSSSESYLVDCYHKVLSKEQRKWQTYETESWVMVKSVIKWAKYIIRALATRTHWEHNKILMLSDSTTAASKWFNILMPEHALDSICAKARRFLSWADKVAYTADWPMVTNHLPGEFNSLSHLLSHVGDLLTAMYENPPPKEVLTSRPTNRLPPPPGDQSDRTQYVPPIDPPFDPRLLTSDPSSRLKALQATTMFVSLHSYHGKRPEVCRQYDEPAHFIINHLNIPVESSADIAAAYGQDTRPFHKVTLQEIYWVATNETHDIHPLVKARIQPWLGTLIFPICPPGSTVPLLYTIASCKLMRWGDPAVITEDERLDLTLVPIIPANCKVKLTALVSIAKDHDDTDHEQYRDLRQDILQAAHALTQPHHSKARTSLNAKAMAYWPDLEKHVEKFYQTCDACLADRTTLKRHGLTLTSTRRGGALMLDKLVFDKDIVDITGIPAAIVFTCVRIADSYPAIVETMTAVEAARVLFCSGITRYSIPYTIISDSEPAFASQVCKELAIMMGVPQWDFGAVTSPQHHGKIEVRMKPYNRALKLAMNDGHIKCRRTLEVVLAKACITANQHMVTYGTTAFTRFTGMVPRTVTDLFASPSTPDFDIKKITASDKHVVDALVSQVNDICDWHQEKRDAAHRSSLHSKLANDASARVTDFHLIPGDMVSYAGERWKLLAVRGPPNQPITADIQQATHADAVLTKTVRYDTLQNLSASREKLNLQLDTVVTAGDYVFFTSSDLTCSGSVLSVDGDSINIHAHDPSPQLQCFLPSWVKGSREKSQREQPRGYAPDTVAVDMSDIEIVTTLSTTGRIPDHAMQQLKSLGITMPFEFNSSHDEALSTPVRAHPATVQSSGSAVRVSRRASFAIAPAQHEWIVDCLNTLSIPPTHDPFLDHALLIQVIINGTSTLPAGAKMDSNLKKIKQRVQGFQADCECRTNQVFRLQFLIMAFPDTNWLKSSPVASRSLPRHPTSPVTAQAPATPITPRGQVATAPPITPRGLPLRRDQPSRSFGKPPSNAHAPSPSTRPSRPRGGPFSPVRTSPSPARSPKTSPSPARSPKSRDSRPSITKSSSENKSVAPLRLHSRKQPQEFLPSTTTPWYLQPSLMLPFMTIHMLAGIGIIQLISLINTFMFSLGN